MGYNIKTGDIVKLRSAKLRVISAPRMSAHFAKRGKTFGWVSCEVIEDSSGKYEVGYRSEFNGDFLRK
jgi:hypothetical protein